MRKNKLRKMMKSRLTAFMLAFFMVAGNVGSSLTISYADDMKAEVSTAVSDDKKEEAKSEQTEDKKEDSKSERSEEKKEDSKSEQIEKEEDSKPEQSDKEEEAESEQDDKEEESKSEQDETEAESKPEQDETAAESRPEQDQTEAESKSEQDMEEEESESVKSEDEEETSESAASKDESEAGSENGKVEEAETELETSEQEEEIEFLSTECSGVTISVEAVTGKLNPEIVEISATEVTDEAMHEVMKAAAAKEGKIYAETKLFDIRLLNDAGEEVQPDGRVKVTFEDSSLAAVEAETNSATVDVVCLKENKEGEAYVAEKLKGSLDTESNELKFETTHFTVYGYGTETVVLSEGIDYDFDSKWSVTYPDVAVETTEGIEAEIVKKYKGNSPYIAKVIYTIPEGFSGDIRVNAMMDIAEAMSGVYMPGQTEACEIEIVNHSGREYAYDNNSFIVATEDNDEAVKNGWGGAKPVSEEVEVRSFDGTLMPLQYSAHRTKNSALKALYAPSSLTQSDIEDAKLDQKLKAYQDESGTFPYPEGIKQLNQYYLDFYNSKYQTSYTKLEEFADQYATVNNEEIGMDIFGSDILGGGSSPFLETNPEVAATSYNYFYNHLYLVYPASMDLPGLASAEWDPYSIGQAMRDVESGDVTLFEPLCREAWGAIESEGTYTMAGFKMSIHGSATNNAYQGYNLGFAIGFELKEVQKTVYSNLTVEKVDEAGERILAPAVFNLYRKDANETIFYYTESGNWTTNKEEAKAITTVDGTVIVENLETGSYYLTETAAPVGYEKAKDSLSFELMADDTTVTFTNVKIALENEYTLTIHYYEKGTQNKLSDSVEQIYEEGDYTYDIQNLVNQYLIEGYTFNSWENLQQASLSGTIGQNLVFNVYYTKNTTDNPVEPEKPESGGNQGGNGGGNNGGSIGGKTPTGPGLAIIPENETPLGTFPETPEASEELVTIEDS